MSANSLLRALALVTCAASLACSDSTGPDKSLRVTFSVLPDSATEYTFIEDLPAIICAYPIRATITGHGAGRWTGGTLRFFSGPNRNVPVDSVTVSPEELSTAFGATQLFGAGEQEAVLRTNFFLPFNVEFEGRYDVSGRAKKATITLACGPQPPANAPLPVISTITIAAPVNLHAGDIINVSAGMSSSFALWESTIRVTGPFTSEKLFHETGHQTSQRPWNFVVPENAALDVPITISVFATDAIGHIVQRDSVTTMALRDFAPPVFTSASFARVDGAGTPQPSDGQLATYDVLGVNVHATDDLGLGYAVIEIDAPVPVRDSVLLAPMLQDQQARFEVKPSWSGGRSVAVHIIDRKGRPSATRIVTPMDSVRFFPFFTRPVVRVNLPAGEGDAVFDPVRGRFYFGDGLQPLIHVVDAATMTLLPSIALPKRVRNFDVSVTGDSLFLALPDAGQIAVLDMRGATPVFSGKPLNVPPLGGGPTIIVVPWDVKRDAQGRMVVLASQESDANDFILTYDLATNNVSWVDDGLPITPKGDLAGALRFVASPDRSRIWAVGGDCSRYYVSATRTLGPCHYLPIAQFNQTHPGLAPDGSELAMREEFFDADLSPIVRPRVTLGAWIETLHWSPDGASWWIAEDWTYDRVRTSDRVRLERTLLPIRAGQMWQDAAGQFLYVYDVDKTAFIRVDLR